MHGHHLGGQHHHHYQPHHHVQSRVDKRAEEEKFVREQFSDLKKHLMYLDKTNWFFNGDTVDFTLYMPFEQDHTSFMKYRK